MLFFVYGSLKAGQRLSPAMRRLEFVAEARTTKPAVLFQGDSWPWVSLSDLSSGVLPVHGELYRGDESCKDLLDYVEGYPTLFYRSKISVTVFEEAEVTAWIYHRECNHPAVADKVVKNEVLGYCWSPK